MTTKQALAILKRHQLWRMGSDRVKMVEIKELTEAMNIAIDILSEQTLKVKKWACYQKSRHILKKTSLN